MSARTATARKVEKPAPALPTTSSLSDEWCTPAWLAAALKKAYGPFDLDPAAAPGTSLGRRSYDRHDGGVERPWRGRVFCNPPHARALGQSVKPWLHKAIAEIDAGRCSCVVLLVPAKTDTTWWHDLVMQHADTVLFLRGRLKYGRAGYTNSATFPSAVVVFTSEAWAGGPLYGAIYEAGKGGAWTKEAPAS